MAMVPSPPRVIRVISLMSPALSTTPLTPPTADRASADFASEPDAACRHRSPQLPSVLGGFRKLPGERFLDPYEGSKAQIQET